jgi:predicted SAM-dependent methyltransferase
VDTAAVQATETIPCPICATEAVKPLYVTEGFTLGRCGGCGLIRQSPRPTAAHIRSSNYDGVAQTRESFFGRDLKRDGLEFWQSQPLDAYTAGVAAVDAQRPSGETKGLWIDVGASTGSLLVAARNAGYEVGGVELGAGQVQVCRETHGFDVFHGALQEAALPDAHADVVSYRHVLEHIHDVCGELSEAHRILKRKGLLLVEVPNFGGLRYKAGRLRTALRVSKPVWRKLNLPEHLYYFTIDTLTQILRRSGFEVLAWGTYGKTRPKRGALRKAYDGVRDRLRVGNKMRVVARRIDG